MLGSDVFISNSMILIIYTLFFFQIVMERFEHGLDMNLQRTHTLYSQTLSKACLWDRTVYHAATYMCKDISQTLPIGP